MARPVIYLAFANHPDQPLLQLSEEDDAIFAQFQNRKGDRSFLNGFEIIREQFTSQNKLIKTLTERKEDICLFHFSGHASDQHLYLADGQGRAEGLVALLADMPHLRFVFLNGCDTDTFAPLLKQNGIEAAIITDREVEDKMAIRLSDHFYNNLTEGESLEESFNAAKNILKTTSDISLVTRTAGRISTKTETQPTPVTFPWGLYLKNKKVSQWKLQDAIDTALGGHKHFVSRVIIACIIALVFVLWTRRHIGASSLSFFLANGPLALILIIGFLLAPFKSRLGQLEVWRQRFVNGLLSNKSLLFFGLIMLLGILFFSSVVLKNDTDEFANTKILKGDKTLGLVELDTDNNAETRLFGPLNSFSNNYTLNVEGFESEEIKLNFGLGFRKNMSALKPKKGLLICVGFDDLMLLNRLSWTIVKDDQVLIENKPINKASIFFGAAHDFQLNAPNVLMQRLMDQNISEPLAKLAAKKWVNIDSTGFNYSIRAGETIDVELFLNDSLMQKKSILLNDEKLQYEILD